MSQIDPDELARRLEDIPVANLVAFAWSCANRLEPYFQVYAEKAGVVPDLVRSILDRISEDWIAASTEHDPALKELAALEGLIPEEEPHQYEPGQMVFEDAIVCGLYTLQALGDETINPALWAGICCGDVADRVAVNTINADLNSADIKAAISLHPDVVGEYARQERDLQELAQDMAKDARRRFVSRRRGERLTHQSEISY